MGGSSSSGLTSSASSNVLSSGLAQGIASLTVNSINGLTSAAAAANGNMINSIGGNGGYGSHHGSNNGHHSHHNGAHGGGRMLDSRPQSHGSASSSHHGHQHMNGHGGHHHMNGHGHQQQQLQHSGHLNGGTNGFNALDESVLANRFNRSLGPLVGSNGNSSPMSDLSNGHGSNHGGGMGVSNPYEKWSNGHDNNRIYGDLGGGSNNSGGYGGNNDAFMDLSLKLQAHQQGQGQGGQMFPPKSQIKRQKMIYHCKFGEFGVLEGQFTEPSGVAVNAQNDIIVADTNNHRIQIFDKEGRFKFQFGECGKRDGQLLYPNRVAVVRQSGDIIVTERSPTHQVQIYNQYGQFVRKFGANILQHPRGVCVDNKGRIIVVECKVMRVIIFDQMGNVLNKFGCSKHLEFPNGVVVNDRQEIFISDNRAHCVKVFNYEGSYLRQIGGEGENNLTVLI